MRIEYYVHYSPSVLVKIVQTDLLIVATEQYGLQRLYLQERPQCMWIYIAQPVQPKQTRGASIG